MKLYHFTDKHITGKIKTSFFGDNLYTSKDKSISKIKRCFFFTTSKPPEYRFTNCKYKYTVNIPDKGIYNLITDNKNLIKRGKSLHYILQRIKRLGYKACLYNIGYNIVISFYDIAI